MNSSQNFLLFFAWIGQNYERHVVVTRSSTRRSSDTINVTNESSSDELEVEDVIEDENEKVEFDINTIVKQLEMQPTVEVYDV